MRGLEKNDMKRGQNIHTQTDIATTRPPRPPNGRVGEKVRRLCIFSSSTFQSQNSKSIFLKKYYIITFLNFFLCFEQCIKKSKNEFPIVFSNLARPMAAGYFRVFIPFLANKHRHGGFFFGFENGPSKLIPYRKSQGAEGAQMLCLSLNEDG